MNFMTGSYAVCIFPRSTFAMHRSYMSTARRVTAGIVRRWTFNTSFRNYAFISRGHELDNSETRTGLRDVGDSRSWVIKFGNVGE
jgi:hypothetical protein